MLNAFSNVVAGLYGKNGILPAKLELSEGKKTIKTKYFVVVITLEHAITCSRNCHDLSSVKVVNKTIFRILKGKIYGVLQLD